jgi:flagellar basal body-associated protein FliL
VKKIIGLVLIIVALAGGIFAGMQLGHKKTDEKNEKKTAEVDFQQKQFLYSKFDKPMIVPIFKNDKAVGMLIAEIWLELEPETDTVPITSKEPRLRDALMQVFYLYASEGRLSASLLEPKTQAELRRDLTHIAKQLIGDSLHAVLINDMQRQDLM